MGKQIFNIKGMMRDLDPAKSPNQYAYEIRNLRLTAQEDSTLLALITEKGNIQYTLTGGSIAGNIVGYCVLNKYITIFTHDTNADHIYRLEEDTTATSSIMTVTSLYSGDLDFDNDTKIEALGVYENENIQKIYWIDGVHQPRFINITKTDYNTTETFNFIKSVSLEETLEITKNFGEGLFNSGTIEYAICYFNKNGQASNITSISPIFYIADQEYGGSPEASVLNNFTIKVFNPDESFEYVRIFSIQRTSMNGTPICKKVTDINISKNIKTSGVNYVLNSFYPSNDNPSYTSISSDTLPDVDKLVVFKSVNDNRAGKPLSEYLYDYTSTSVVYRIPKDYILCTTLGINAGSSVQVIGYSNDTTYMEVTHNITTDTVTLSTSGTKKYTAIFLGFSSVPYIEYRDYGYSSESVDYAELLYIGGSVLKPKSMESKDGTLFFGNYTYDSIQLTSSLIETIRDGVSIKFGYSETPVSKGDSSSWYQYNNQLDLNNEIITTFKGGETYTFGIILQDQYGVWSSVIPLKSVKNIYYPFEADEYFRPVKAGIKLTDIAYAALKDAGILRVKAVLLNDRSYQSVFYQGALCPTVFSKERSTSNVYAQSSWYARNIPYYLHAADHNRIPQRTHNRNIASIYNDSMNTIAEVYGASNSFINDTDLDAGDNPADFFVDWNTLTLHSPDIHFEETYTKGLKNMRLIGRLPIKSVRTNMQLTLKTPGKAPTAGLEYNKHQSQNSVSSNYHDLSLFAYLDYATDANGGWVTTQKFLYPILTWHRLGSVTMQPEPTGDWVAELDTKVMSTIKVCPKTTFTASQFPIDTTELLYYKDDSQPVFIEQDENDLDFPDIRMYLGEVDSVVTSSIGMKAVAKNQEGTLQNAYNYHNKQGVRMRYKSTPHGVLSLKYSSEKLQTILPNVPSNSSVKLPFWSKQSDNIPSYDYQLKSSRDIYIDGTNVQDGAGHSRLIIKASYANTFFDESVEVNDTFILNYTGGSFIGGSMTSDDINNYVWYLHSKNYTYNGETYYTLWRFDSEYIGDTTYWNTKPDGDYEYIFALISDTTIVRYREIIEYRRGDNSVASWTVQPYINIGTMDRATSGINKLTGYENDLHFDYLYLAEYYRNSPTIDLFTSHSWVVASPSIRVTELNKLLPVTYGDTYYQRYDCLKTYPYSLEDPNQVVEIFSFMCETRMNIDGRYDTRRGQANNTSVLGTNFNLLNKAYTQEDNFFSYHYLDPSEYDIYDFPNQLIWTKTKVYGSDIDNWTQIIPTSTLDMDGTLGEIRALKLWNDNLMCFQDKGIAKIMYNERTTISTQQGVPVEIANSGKVDGSQYISNQIGCINKDSIQVTQEGIYFIDNNTREIYRWTKGLESLSKSKGFNTYLYNNSNLDTEKTFYDPKLKDVYFEFGSECLVYNEQLAEFTSFLDYDMKFMFPFKDSLIAIKNNTLWEQFAGNYLSFFGSNKGYSIEIISAEKPTEDKIFSTVEFRADVLDNDNHLAARSDVGTDIGQFDFASYNKLPFDSIRAWNEYQDTGHYDNANSVWVDVALQSMIRRGTNMSQKFRIWRADIPRVYGKPLERIRNPWARIKLSDAGGNKKTVIHDIGVTYF